MTDVVAVEEVRGPPQPVELRLEEVRDRRLSGPRQPREPDDARRLAEQGAPGCLADCAVVLSPGPMDTELMRTVLGTGLVNVPPGLLQDPLDVARDLLERLDALTPADAGAWLYRTGEPLTAPTKVFGH